MSADRHDSPQLLQMELQNANKMGNPLMSLEFSISSGQTSGQVKTNTPATLWTCLFNSLLCGVCGGTYGLSFEDPVSNQFHILIFHSMEQLWIVCKTLQHT